MRQLRLSVPWKPIKSSQAHEQGKREKIKLHNPRAVLLLLAKQHGDCEIPTYSSFLKRTKLQHSLELSCEVPLENSMLSSLPSSLLCTTYELCPWSVLTRPAGGLLVPGGHACSIASATLHQFRYEAKRLGASTLNAKAHATKVLVRSGKKLRTANLPKLTWEHMYDC